MLKIKGYRQSKKCATYIKRMISKGTWRPNEKIPTLGDISFKLGISLMTVRKVLRQFEMAGIIENWGSMGYYLKVNNIKPISKNKFYSSAILGNLFASNLLHVGGIKTKNWIISYSKDDSLIQAYNDLTGKIFKVRLDEVKDTLTNLISLENLLSIKNESKFKQQKIKYLRQREIFPMIKVFVKHKKELGVE